MDFITRDVRIALRGLLRTPVFTLIAVAILGLGIGVNTAVFTILDAVRFRSLPLPQAHELINVYGSRDGGPLAYADYVDYRRLARTFSGLAAHEPRQFRFGGHTQSEIIWGEAVSSNYFVTLQVQAAKGRLFSTEYDDAGPGYPAVVISNGFWRSQLAGDPDIVGKTIDLNGQSLTVIGVAQAGFRGTFGELSLDIWVPFFAKPLITSDARNTLENRRLRTINVIGRLAAGSRLDRASAELLSISAGLDREYPIPTWKRAGSLTVESAAGMHPSFRSVMLGGTSVLMAVVVLVLLIACANLSNLLLMRSDARRRQFAVRLAIGASRYQIMRQLLAESLLLSLAGAALAVVFARWALVLLPLLRPPIQRSIDLDLSINLRVLAFTFIVAGATTVLFGLAPALRTCRLDIVTGLKGDALFRRPRLFRFVDLRSIFVMAQVTISMTLLVVSGLFLVSLRNAVRMNPGFDSEHVVVITLPNLRLWQVAEPRAKDLYQRVKERAEAVPGVHSAALVEDIPLSITYSQWRIGADSGGASLPEQLLSVGVNIVGPGLFSTLRIPLLQGRDFGPQDTAAGSKVAVINAELAHRLWPGQQALGRYVRRTTSKGAGPPLEVVGIVGTGKYFTLNEDPRPFVFVPFEQNYAGDMTVVVSTIAPPATLVTALSHAVLPLESRLPIQVKPIRESMQYAFWPARTGAVLFTFMGVLALLLASMGLYGVMVYSVAQRTREIGIRMAVGASAANVLGMVFLRSLRLVACGVSMGLGFAFIGVRLIGKFLYGIAPTDAATFAAAAVVMITVGMFATYVPARNALRVQPLTALRHD